MIVGGIANHQRSRGLEAKFFAKIYEHPGVRFRLALIGATRRIKVSAQPRLIKGAFKANARFSSRNAHCNPAFAQGVEHFAHPVEELEQWIAAEIMDPIALHKFAKPFWR